MYQRDSDGAANVIIYRFCRPFELLRHQFMVHEHYLLTGLSTRSRHASTDTDFVYTNDD